MSIATSFAQTAFARFINTTPGRIARIVAGLGLIAWGYSQRAETTGIILMVAGLVPLVAGVFHLCLISALLGGPIRGARIAGGKAQS